MKWSGALLIRLSLQLNSNRALSALRSAMLILWSFYCFHKLSMQIRLRVGVDQQSGWQDFREWKSWPKTMLCWETSINCRKIYDFYHACFHKMLLLCSRSLKNSFVWFNLSIPENFIGHFGCWWQNCQTGAVVQLLQCLNGVPKILIKEMDFWSNRQTCHHVDVDWPNLKMNFNILRNRQHNTICQNSLS